MPTTMRGKVILRYCKKYPNTKTYTLSKMLHERMPKLFIKSSSALNGLNYYRGTGGEQSRRHVDYGVRVIPRQSGTGRSPEKKGMEIIKYLKLYPKLNPSILAEAMMHDCPGLFSNYKQLQSNLNRYRTGRSGQIHGTSALFPHVGPAAAGTAVLDYLKKHPLMSTQGMAKIISHQYPQFFKSYRYAVSIIGYYRGINGGRHREELVDRGYAIFSPNKIHKKRSIAERLRGLGIGKGYGAAGLRSLRSKVAWSEMHKNESLSLWGLAQVLYKTHHPLYTSPECAYGCVRCVLDKLKRDWGKGLVCATN